MTSIFSTQPCRAYVRITANPQRPQEILVFRGIGAPQRIHHDVADSHHHPDLISYGALSALPDPLSGE